MERLLQYLANEGILAAVLGFFFFCRCFVFYAALWLLGFPFALASLYSLVRVKNSVCPIDTMQKRDQEHGTRRKRSDIAYLISPVKSAADLPLVNHAPNTQSAF